MESEIFSYNLWENPRLVVSFSHISVHYVQTSLTCDFWRWLLKAALRTSSLSDVSVRSADGRRRCCCWFSLVDGDRTATLTSGSRPYLEDGGAPSSSPVRCQWPPACRGCTLTCGHLAAGTSSLTFSFRNKLFHSRPKTRTLTVTSYLKTYILRPIFFSFIHTLHGGSTWRWSNFTLPYFQRVSTQMHRSNNVKHKLT